MSLLKEYKELDELRLKEGKMSKEHYDSLNLPGDRVVSATSRPDAKERIKAMKKEQENQLFWDK